MAQCPEPGQPLVQETLVQRQQRYCFDTDALISLHHDDLLPRLKRWADVGFVTIPTGVSRELEERDRSAYRFVSGWRADVFVDPERDEGAHRILPRLFRAYGEQFSLGRYTYKGLATGPRGYKAAEFEMIALAKANGWTAVSNENSVHGACTMEIVMCLDWTSVRTLLLAGRPPGSMPLPGL